MDKIQNSKLRELLINFYQRYIRRSSNSEFKQDPRLELSRFLSQNLGLISEFSVLNRDVNRCIISWYLDFPVLVKTFIKHGLYGDPKDDYKINFELFENRRRPLLHHCTNLEVCRFLVESGFPLNALDKDGNIALFSVLRDELVEIQSFYLKVGMNVNFTNVWGETPLVRSLMFKGQLKTVSQLLDYNASVKIDSKELLVRGVTNAYYGDIKDLKILYKLLDSGLKLEFPDILKSEKYKKVLQVVKYCKVRSTLKKLTSEEIDLVQSSDDNFFTKLKTLCKSNTNRL